MKDDEGDERDVCPGTTEICVRHIRKSFWFLMGVHGPVTTDTGVGTYDGIGGPNIVGNGGYRMYGRLTFEPDKTLFPLPSELGVGDAS